MRRGLDGSGGSSWRAGDVLSGRRGGSGRGLGGGGGRSRLSLGLSRRRRQRKKRADEEVEGAHLVHHADNKALLLDVVGADGFFILQDLA